MADEKSTVVFGSDDQKTDDAQGVEPEHPESIFGDTPQPDPEVNVVPPGEPVPEPEMDIQPPTRGWMPYAISGVLLIAILALGALLVGSDRTGPTDDSDADIVAEKLVEETVSAPTLDDDADSAESPAVRLAGIDASKCDLSQIEVKDGMLGIDRDCLSLVFEPKPVVITAPSP